MVSSTMTSSRYNTSSPITADTILCKCCGNGNGDSSSSTTNGYYSVPARFSGALRHILEDLNQEFGDKLIGVLVTGSVATGDISITSDLDLFVIHKEPHRKRKTLKVQPHQFIPPLPPSPDRSPIIPAADLAGKPSYPSDNTNTNNSNSNSTSRKKQILPSSLTSSREIVTELFINPPFQMRAEISRLEDPTVQAWRSGHILIDDPANTLASLRNFAIETYAKGKPSALTTWSTYQTALTRHHLMDQLNDAWDAIDAGDAASGTAMIHRAMASCLDLLYKLNGWWSVKEKRIMADLAARRQESELARKVLPLVKRISRGDLESVERHKSLSELVDIALEPLGGRVREWTTDWEECKEL